MGALTKNKFKISFILLTLVNISLAQNTPQPSVRYLFQSVANTDEFKLAENNELNILFINDTCVSCFKRIEEIQRMKPASKFIVVTAPPSLLGFKKDIQKQISANALKYIYFDPGERFKKSIQHGTDEVSFVSYYFGKIETNYKTNLSTSAKNPYDLKAWK